MGPAKQKELYTVHKLSATLFTYPFFTWHPVDFIQLLLHDSFHHLNNQMFGWEFNTFWLEL